MFENLFSSGPSVDPAVVSKKNRRHARRADDRCVSIVNGQMYPVENWSNGGMLVNADERLFGIGQECVFTLKFKLADRMVEIDHKAKVARKAPHKVGFEFLPLSKDAKQGFQKVVDDYVAQKFVESQA